LPISTARNRFYQTTLRKPYSTGAWTGRGGLG